VSGECASLQPKRVRKGKPTWWYCEFSGKEIDPENKPCTRDGCLDYLERGENTVAGDTCKRINWDGPASDVMPGEDGTLREWAAERIASGASMAGIAKTIGCTWGTLQNAIGKSAETRKEPSGTCAEETQPAASKREVMGTCWNCNKHVPEPEMFEHDGDLYCPDCYHKAHEPVAVADRVARETTLGPDTLEACQAYLRYLGLGEAEASVLPVFIAGYLARGAEK
jgi:Zn finger protein HypA/HybF involved in hydrogenase expression